jgi:hypothetical protein
MGKRVVCKYVVLLLQDVGSNNHLNPIFLEEWGVWKKVQNVEEDGRKRLFVDTSNDVQNW